MALPPRPVAGWPDPGGRRGLQGPGNALAELRPGHVHVSGEAPWAPPQACPLCVCAVPGASPTWQEQSRGSHSRRRGGNGGQGSSSGPGATVLRRVGGWQCCCPSPRVSRSGGQGSVTDTCLALDLWPPVSALPENTGPGGQRALRGAGCWQALPVARLQEGWPVFSREDAARKAEGELSCVHGGVGGSGLHARPSTWFGVVVASSLKASAVLSGPGIVGVFGSWSRVPLPQYS